MLASYSILNLDPATPFSTTFRLAVAAREFLKGCATDAQIAVLLEEGCFQIVGTETLDFADADAEPDRLDPEAEIAALTDIPDPTSRSLYVNRLNGRMYLADPTSRWTRVRPAGNMIPALARSSVQPRAANDQPQRSLDEGTRNIASYIVGHAVPALESEAQNVVRLGRPIEVGAAEMVSMLVMSITLARHQRLEVEHGRIRPEQAIMPRDVLRCIKIATPLSVAV